MPHDNGIREAREESDRSELWQCSHVESGG